MAVDPADTELSPGATGDPPSYLRGLDMVHHPVSGREDRSCSRSQGRGTHRDGLEL